MGAVLLMRLVIYGKSAHSFLRNWYRGVHLATVGLKHLTKEHDSLMSKIYEDIVNGIYCQLSDYARKKIYIKGQDVGVNFPHKEQFERYRHYKFLSRHNKEWRHRK